MTVNAPGAVTVPVNVISAVRVMSVCPPSTAVFSSSKLPTFYASDPSEEATAAMDAKEMKRTAR